MTIQEIQEAQADFTTGLLPCPFCGAKPIVYCCDVVAVWFTAECHDCCLSLDKFKSLEEAADAWNTRA